MSGPDEESALAVVTDPVPTERFAFESALSFPLDQFQREAFDLIDDGHSVLVAAPTGSGKTLVAEYAVARARKRNERAFYTTPLKALSNQKFRDFTRQYGEGEVGLLTGDVSLFPNAPIVVMTTEVLRNMIYSERTLGDLGCIVLDEVHFLADRYRGSVWEEIILSAHEEVLLVSLSATVSNAEELARWMETVRGSTVAVIEEKRPVQLEQLYVIGDRRGGDLRVIPTFIGDSPNRVGATFDVDFGMRRSTRSLHPQGGGQKTRSGARKPRRSEVVERFAQDGLLPAIYFIFSRAGCDDAVRQCLDDHVRLTSHDERREIRAIVERHVERLTDEDRRALHYGRFLHGLEAGIGAHHAGLVPAFREAVEELFTKLLVKVVFATETLALGINMPARSVVIESLSKFAGAGHKDLSPGEYTQLTGRAGRRGTDDVGYAAVLWSPLHRFEEVASLASARASALRSSFRPNYNMVVNLVRRYDRDSAFRLVRSSFAQYLSERPLVNELHAVIELLSSRGYLAGWRVTESGERLSGLYHESDLLVAEALGAGLLNGLDAPSLAAVLSCITFEARRSDRAADFPSGRIARRVDELDELARELRHSERAAGLPRTRRTDPGFVRIVFDWAKGAELAQVLPQEHGSGGRRSSAMSGGDFVRNMKQLLDLLRQVAMVEGDSRLANTAETAISTLLRGIVAASSTVDVPEVDGTVEVADDPR